PLDRELEEGWIPDYFEVRVAPGLNTITFRASGSAVWNFGVLNRFEETDYHEYSDWDTAIIRAAKLSEFENQATPSTAPPPTQQTQTPAEQLWKIFSDVVRDAVHIYFAEASDAEAAWREINR